MAVASLRSTGLSLGPRALVGVAVFRTCGQISGPDYDARVLDPKVFKAYDVRGVHPTELDEDGAYRIGRAYVEEFEPRIVVVDPITSFLGMGINAEVTSMLVRLIDFLKTRQITFYMTSLSDDGRTLDRAGVPPGSVVTTDEQVAPDGSASPEASSFR